MERALPFLSGAIDRLIRRSDLILAVALMGVVFMLVLPLPTMLVDILVAINIGLAALLLMVAMYLPDSLAFASFPSVLLLTTLFRLGLSIATTRLILLQADAGHIIEAFGNFVVGGNIVVGLVVFLILTVVQFIVITKGAERVAEVAARFSLDGMPGKQMSIDADMRAGAIDMKEAKRRRSRIEKESQLYGAMDVTVVALIGERGREVRELLERELGQEGLKRAVVVCSTSDRPSMERLKAAFVATAIAEYFRDQGMKVLLLMDSLTRMARAQREIGLAAGEPPTRRGFPPSVFGLLPRLLERAGMSHRGSITAFYTVLVEGDDMSEPIADETRSILDGHVVLSRKLAAAGQYPAVDVLESVSRVMGSVAAPLHLEQARAVRALLSKYAEVEFLLRVGEYSRGADALADKAIDRIDDIRAFLCQRPDENVAPADVARRLAGLAA